MKHDGSAPSITRRQFLGRVTTAAGALAIPYYIPASALGRGGVLAPSERILTASIGLGGRGTGGLGEMLAQPDVRVVAVCDVIRGRRENGKMLADRKYGTNDCAMYRDFRQMLAERPELDAVYIATSERWHTPVSVIAMKAGKDVYCEKPSAFTIAEAQTLAAVAKQFGAVFQTGAQRASSASYIFAGELLRTGRLGKPTTLYAHLGCLPRWPRTNTFQTPEPEPPKEELDWDLWVGPSPWRPFNSDLANKHGWMRQIDFSVGIAQFGAHTILQCQLDLGLGETSAVEYEYTTDLNKKGMTIRFANGAKVVSRTSGWHGNCGIRYEGTEGWVEAADGYDRPEV
ncbi:MAG: twin-arginine translocation signal domain-containing protein, partial [Verrucomicrobia bacterium]|nr:twin-arginine translocation signal domain-containing protein [Verrucomicrobiota bacterium]